MRSKSVRRGSAWLAASVIFCSLGCATYSDRTAAAREALQRGDLAGSEKQLNKFLKVRRSEDLPTRSKKNFELVILERATVLQAGGKYELSARDFGAADKQLELLDIAKDTAGKIGKYIYSDSATKYKTSPTEKLSLNAMNLCNYLAQGDLNGAKVEAKRFTVMRNYMRDYDPEHEHLAFGSYLAGFVYEKLGNPNEALRYYEEALQEREFSTLRDVLPGLAASGSYRGERIKDYLPPDVAPSAPAVTPKPTPKPKPDPDPSPKAEPVAPKPEADADAKSKPKSLAKPADPTPTADPPTAAAPVQRPKASSELGSIAVSTHSWAPSMLAPRSKGGEILVVSKVGRVPYKVPERIPIGLAIGLAGAFVTGDTTLLEYGMFKFVVYPELVPGGSLFETASVRIDGHSIGTDIASDLTTEIIAEYEDLKPKIIGAALTRMITRAAAAEGARAAGKQAEGAGALVGFLAAAAVEGTLVALDKPDTRSWTTLPARVLVSRAATPAGSHRVEVTVSGPGGREIRTVEVTVPEGGFVVLDVTTLR